VLLMVVFAAMFFFMVDQVLSFGVRQILGLGG
jgi:preprotein translocase subunit SecE